MSWAFKILRRTVVRELGRHNKANRSYKSCSTYKNAGDQKLLRGIYMPTTILHKTSPSALRTFKRFGASCYSGVPVFPTETRPLTV